MLRGMLWYQLQEFALVLIPIFLLLSFLLGLLISFVTNIALLQLWLAFFGFFVAAHIVNLTRWIGSTRWKPTKGRLLMKNLSVYLASAFVYAFTTTNDGWIDIASSLLIFFPPLLLLVLDEIVIPDLPNFNL